MSERICTNCSASIPEGGQFCTSCGTPAPAAAAPPAPSAPAGSDATTVMAAPAWPAPEPEASAPPAPTWSQPAPPQDAPPPAAPGSWQQPAAPQPPTQTVPVTQQAPAWTPPPQSQPQQAPGWQQPQPAGGQQWGAAPPQQYQPAGPAVAYETAPKKKKNVLGGLLAFVGAIVLVAGAFTVWVRTNVATFAGWDVSDDAKAVVGLAAAALLFGVMVIAGIRNIVIKLVLIGLGIAAIAIGVVNIIDVGDLPDVLDPAIGLGLILVPVGGVVLLLSGLFTRTAK